MTRPCLRSGAALFALLAALTLATAATGLEVPFLAGRVNDYAEILSAAAEERITAKLEAHEAETGNQVAVLTVASLEGDALESFSLRVAETWALGRAGVDDGVLLLVARDDRKMRIEVGYGLEGALTDAQSGRILRNILTPHFRAGDFDGGIEQGIDAILGTLAGGDVIPASAPAHDFAPGLGDLGGRLAAGGLFLLVVGMFSLVALFSPGCQSWFLYVFLMPFWGAFPAAFLSPKVGLVSLAAWVVGFPILKLILSSTGAGKRWVSSHPGWTNWTSGGGGGWSGGGGGGFSGGGGSFGGGGASGSW